MQRGVPLWEAAGYLNMTPDTLQRVYGHHHPDFLRGAAEAFEHRPRLGVALGAEEPLGAAKFQLEAG